MSELKIQNAKITSTMLGVEDHGIFTCMLYLDYGGAGQGAGGYAMDTPKNIGDKTVRVGTIFGMQLIIEVLRVVGVSKWEDLPGKHVRASASYDKVVAIGNVLRDDWLNFSDLAARYKD